jgi:transposase-like protein
MLLIEQRTINRKNRKIERGKFLCPECGRSFHYELSLGLSKKKCLSCSRTQGKKLKKEEVKDIRRLYKTGKFTLRSLANLYKISHNMVWLIMKNRTWKFE